MKKPVRYTASVILMASFLVIAGDTTKAVTISAPSGYKTAIHDKLLSLPQPKAPVVVAVYKFRDQTGQYKTSASGQTWSTAVTQGATSMLIKALEDSRWFVPVEREGLSDLLNERKIITTMRESYAQQNKEEPAPLPPLLYAGIILEGGIIAYESNLITAGAGIRYFGLGSDIKVAQDRVTIYLRAVSTQTGQVLKTVYTTKTILSKQINASLYRFVRFKQLLEAEAGITTNEPVQMCVNEAIEEAVMNLIIEGILNKTWALQNENAMQDTVIQEYIKKNESQLTDISALFPIHRKVSVCASLGLQWTGGVKHSDFEPAGAAQIWYKINPYCSTILSIGAGDISSKSQYHGAVLSVDLKGEFELFPEWRITPCIIPGIGVVKYWVRDSDGSQLSPEKGASGGIFPTYALGGGVRCRISVTNSIVLELQNHRNITDHFYTASNGVLTDNYWTLLAGVSVSLPQIGKKE